MPARRSRGDGGLSRDSTRQRWVASVTVGYAASEKRIFKRARGRTKSEAQRKLKQLLREHEDGLVIGGYGYTVADAVNDWLAFGLSLDPPAHSGRSFRSDSCTRSFRG